MIKFYTDSHIAKAIAVQLRNRSVDIVRCQDVGMDDADDIEHLEYAASQGRTIIYHPQSGWFEDTPLKGGTEAGYPLKGVEEGTSLLGLRSVGGTTTALR